MIIKRKLYSRAHELGDKRGRNWVASNVKYWRRARDKETNPAIINFYDECSKEELRAGKVGLKLKRTVFPHYPKISEYI